MMAHTRKRAGVPNIEPDAQVAEHRRLMGEDYFDEYTKMRVANEKLIGKPAILHLGPSGPYMAYEGEKPSDQ